MGCLPCLALVHIAHTAALSARRALEQVVTSDLSPRTADGHRARRAAEKTRETRLSVVLGEPHGSFLGEIGKRGLSDPRPPDGSLARQSTAPKLLLYTLPLGESRAHEAHNLDFWYTSHTGSGAQASWRTDLGLGSAR